MLPKYGRTVCLPPESTSSVLHRNLSGNLRKEDLLHMITIETIYYIVVIASIICGAAYKIGYEHGKNARK